MARLQENIQKLKSEGSEDESEEKVIFHNPNSSFLFIFCKPSFLQ